MKQNNVILLSIDALRADHLSCYGYHRETSPFIDKFASSNVLYEESYSGGPNTREGVPALITGQYPDEAIGSDYRLDTEPIASVLSAAGYQTAAFHSNPYISRAFGMDEGFDTYDDDLHLGKNKLVALLQRAIDKLRNKHYARAETINQRSLNWLDNRDDGPFFLWNHYMDVHGPYEPPAETRQRFDSDEISDRKAQRLYQKAVKKPESISDSERALLKDLYDEEIRYTDTYIEEFISELEHRGLLEDSLVIITGDHGDAFGEHGYFEHPRYLHDEIVHVPMIVSAPGLGAATDTTTPVSTVDIASTIFDFVGVDRERPGGSLLSLADERPADRVVFSQVRGEDDNSHIRRYAARDGRHTALGEYDSESETVEITTSESTEIESRLREHISSRLGQASVEQTEDDIENEEIERRLSALGYK